MKLSTKIRYGTRALVFMGSQKDESPVSLYEISVNEEISVKYLETIMNSLRLYGLVKSIKGARGGYVLGKDISRITLADIFFALEGAVDLVECISRPESCKRKSRCSAYDVWSELSRTISQKLKSITLKDIIEKKYAQKRAITYHI
jgi:Rrf2 family protein